MTQACFRAPRHFFNSPTIATLCLLTWLSLTSHAQTLQVIHAFTGGLDGAYPFTGVTLDRAGNLYGTAAAGGVGNGTLFKLAHTGSGWVFHPLYAFHGSDGVAPYSPLLFGPDGALYGTTQSGGQYGHGTVFSVTPPATICRSVSCPWTETVLYSFTGTYDSLAPQGHLIFDSSGNLYGTAYGNNSSGTPGGGGNGSVWELIHTGRAWTIDVIYGFTGLGFTPVGPLGGVIFDRAGNLYGTTFWGGVNNIGTVFQLTRSGSGWTVNILHSFDSMEFFPQAGLVADQAGNMYGATFEGAYAFELTPSGGSWNFASIYQITTFNGPFSDLTLDAQGNVYGATYTGGTHALGNIFKLTQSNGVWSLTDVYDFTGGNDGSHPTGSVILDSQGNIYGTASDGGAAGFGTVWVLTP